MKSNASESVEPIERRISTNGRVFRIEFKPQYSSSWKFYSTFYNTIEAAKNMMDTLNDTDSRLAGDWNVVGEEND